MHESEKSSAEGQNSSDFDAFLLLAYGGPRRAEEIAPYLDRIFTTRSVSAQRRFVAEQKYLALGGLSPLDEQCRVFLRKLSNRIRPAAGEKSVSVFLGTLFGEPSLREAVERLYDDHRRSVCVMTASAYGSETACLRYQQMFFQAVEQVESDRGISAESAEKIRFCVRPPYADDPLFLKAQTNALLTILADEALDDFRRGDSRCVAPLVLFTAHALPIGEARRSSYERQLLEAAEKIAQNAGIGPRCDSSPIDDVAERVWSLAFQSRVGPPESPWTGPAAREFLEEYFSRSRRRRLVIVPLGFLFENMETAYDLDRELVPWAESLNVECRRVQAVGVSEEIVEMAARFFYRPAEPNLCSRRCEICELGCKKS